MEHVVLTETCVYNDDNVMMTHFHFCYVTWIHRCTVHQRIFHISLKSVNVRTSQTPSLKNIERLNGLLFWNTAYNLYWNILNMCTIKPNSIPDWHPSQVAWVWREARVQHLFWRIRSSHGTWHRSLGDRVDQAQSATHWCWNQTSVTTA